MWDVVFSACLGPNTNTPTNTTGMMANRIMVLVIFFLMAPIKMLFGQDTSAARVVCQAPSEDGSRATKDIVIDSSLLAGLPSTMVALLRDQGYPRATFVIERISEDGRYIDCSLYRGPKVDEITWTLRDGEMVHPFTEVAQRLGWSVNSPTSELSKSLSRRLQRPLILSRGAEHIQDGSLTIELEKLDVETSTIDGQLSLGDGGVFGQLDTRIHDPFGYLGSLFLQFSKTERDRSSLDIRSSGSLRRFAAPTLAVRLLMSESSVRSDMDVHVEGGWHVRDGTWMLGLRALTRRSAISSGELSRNVSIGVSVKRWGETQQASGSLMVKAGSGYASAQWDLGIEDAWGNFSYTFRSIGQWNGPSSTATPIQIGPDDWLRGIAQTNQLAETMELLSLTGIIRTWGASRMEAIGEVARIVPPDLTTQWHSRIGAAFVQRANAAWLSIMVGLASLNDTVRPFSAVSLKYELP